MHTSEICLYCQEPITQPERGRKRSFCSGTHRTAYARQKRREATERASEMELQHLIQVSPRERKALTRGVAPETSDFLLEVLGRYGLSVAQLVAQGIQIEMETQRHARPHKKPGHAIVDAR